MRLRSQSPDSTRAAARALAAAIDSAGLVVALIGPLGAGKTVFTKGLAEGLGIDPNDVASPTFTIACEYPTRDGRRLAHVDLYRVGSPGELESAGFLDLLEPGHVVVVEWADRFPDALPPDRLEIRIECPDPEGAASERALNTLALGRVARGALARWHSSLESSDRAAGMPEVR